MFCRVCSSVGRRILDKPTTSKIGSKLFSRYLLTNPQPRQILLRNGTFRYVKKPENVGNLKVFFGGRRYITSDQRNDSISRWTDLGISQSLAERLLTSYPHIIQPTPAQKLFFLSVGAGKEVYLKDDMGRGKTLALALSALNLAIKSSIDENGGVKIMILVPTPYLAHQIHGHLVNLSPNSESPIFSLLRPSHSTSSEPSKITLPSTPIIISTPKDLLSYNLNSSSLDSLKYIYLDEPDTMIGSIPSRNSTPEMLRNHNLFKHPPTLIPILNKLLNIQPGKYNGENSDFSNRKNGINTIWISSSLNKDFKRLVKTRGWIKKGNRNLVDLDFTEGASDKLKDLRGRLLVAVENKFNKGDGENGVSKEKKDKSRETHHQIKPKHYALVIDPKDGSISSLNPNSPSSYIPPNKRNEDDNLINEKREIPIEMIESLSLIHALSSSSFSAGYSLILPPEGISLNTLSEELSNLGISSLILSPDTIKLDLDLLSLPKDGDIPVLLATRSSITGLHLDSLDTIYLLDGLDIKGLSKQKRKSGGMKDRYGFYSLVEGRLGRLGNSSGVNRQKQRVISLVMDGTEDEKRLKEFFGDSANGKKLEEWDVRGMERALESELAVDEDEEVGEVRDRMIDSDEGNGLDGEGLEYVEEINGVSLLQQSEMDTSETTQSEEPKLVESEKDGKER